MSNQPDNAPFDEPPSPTNQTAEQSVIIKILKVIGILFLIGVGLIVLALVALFVMCAVSK